MSYIDNPYDSDTGKELLKKNLKNIFLVGDEDNTIESCLLYTSPSPRDGLLSRMPSSA